jgi:hypothetical protein
VTIGHAAGTPNDRSLNELAREDWRIVTWRAVLQPPTFGSAAFPPGVSRTVQSVAVCRNEAEGKKLGFSNCLI